MFVLNGINNGKVFYTEKVQYLPYELLNGFSIDDPRSALRTMYFDFIYFLLIIKLSKRRVKKCFGKLIKSKWLNPVILARPVNVRFSGELNEIVIQIILNKR